MSDPPNTGLIEELCALADRLPGEHASAWADVLAAAAGPDEPGLEAALLAARPGYGMAADAARIVRAWRGEPATPAAAAAAALRAAATMAERTRRHRPAVVVSGPRSAGQPARLTTAVLSQLIRQAQREVLIVSFAASHTSPLVTELVAAADRGVRIDLVLEESTNAHAPFARLRRRAHFWHWPAHRRGGDGRAALHAKVIAADRSAALIGSANLTARALTDNIELGVLLRDPAAVARVVGHFRALMNGERPYLLPLPAPSG
ncbi:DISARM system phospholipase D-like protein DrmC [Salinactinospora qingdaonensis]|uniref:PLD phosphodiesterase domain-containing protein n=1 Tax=Salinactinospora qingdaonensis TaxID=702744 RepID=A0ABP7EWM3_9ACTN